MPIIETAVAKCDVCGREEAARVFGAKELLVSQPPYGWTKMAQDGAFINTAGRKLLLTICPAHTIQVTHNGDVVTLVKGNGV